MLERIKNLFDRQKQKQLLYRMVFETVYGREVLTDLAAECFMDSSTFSKDPIVMAQNEGRRQVLLYILGILKMNLEQLGESTYGNEPQYDLDPAGSPGS